MLTDLVYTSINCQSYSNKQAGANTFIGFVSAIMLCVCSGLAGVYFELMLRVRPERVWVRVAE